MGRRPTAGDPSRSAGTRASGDSAAPGADARRCDRACPRALEAALRRSSPRPRACGTPLSRLRGRKRQSPRACPCVPEPPLGGAYSPLYPLHAMAQVPEKLLLAAPRGYCAGVDRAVQTVERALELYGPPVYVRKEIVHNKHVVEQLRERGAIFVEEES